jgi:hypothetical protein
MIELTPNEAIALYFHRLKSDEFSDDMKQFALSQLMAIDTEYYAIVNKTEPKDALQPFERKALGLAPMPPIDNYMTKVFKELLDDLPAYSEEELDESEPLPDEIEEAFFQNLSTHAILS